MNGQITVVINQIIIFSILMCIGFISVKSKVFTREALNAISRLVVKIILPALIFSIVADSGVTLNDFQNSGSFAVGVLLCFASLIATGIVIGKICGLQGKSANVFVALITFGNMGFMGIPLIQGIFKEPIAQVCISVYTMIDMALL